MTALAIKQAAQPNLTLVGATQNDFRRLTLSTRLRLREIAERLARGEVVPRTWAELVYEELLEGHTSSARLGRLRIGGEPGLSVVDAVRGRSVADTEADFLLNFRAQVEDGKYTDADGNYDAAKISRRLDRFTGKMRGTANEAMRENAPEEAECWWELGAVEEHCPDCPVLHAMSPFTRDTLFQVPGDNLTPCRFNCKCHLRWELDGYEIDGFKPV